MKTNFYTSLHSEINIRNEFDRTLSGFGHEIGKGQTGLIRKFRRSDTNALIACQCVDKVTKEPDRETLCPICRGEGYIWDESEIKFYLVDLNDEPSAASQDQQIKAGITNTKLKTFYISSTYDLTSSDKLILLKLSKSGAPIKPIQRELVFRIANLRPMRLDNAKLEFWKALCYEDLTKYI